MTPQTKNFAIGLILGSILFAGLYYAYLKPEATGEDSTAVTDEDIEDVINAYTLALENQEDQAGIDKLNSDIAQEYRVRVYQRKSDGRLVVTDLKGKELKVV